MATQVMRAFYSKFALWILGGVIGSYFLFSVDTKKLQDSSKPIMQRVLDSVRMPSINLGIDLQGGTYLVLEVEIEKAVERRLMIEMRGIDKLLKKEGVARPQKKEIAGAVATCTFSDDQKAREAAEILKQNTNIKVAAQGAVMTVTLSSMEETRIRTTSVEQAITVLRTRLDTFDVRGLIVQQHGDKNIVIQLPGMDDAEGIKSTIMKTANLEFKMVEEYKGSKDALLDKFDGDLPSDMMIVPSSRQSDGDARGYYLVSAFPDLTGEHIADASVTYDEYQRSVVSFKLDSEGAREFRELTGSNIGRQLGIVMDGVMICAPNINSEIGGQGVIQGKFSPEEAGRLASLLKSGALLAPLKFEQENRVGASLGQDSIRKGLFACIVALLLLFFFALLYYRLMGLFAIMGLVYNLFVIMLVLSYFKATLTLPGIAGMVLTVGMAIDASILIYEHMREEFKNGASLRQAVDKGFGGAMVVIIDSNITTFLTGLVLFQFGGPAIRGFAVTLMVGIVATVIAGVYFLRSIFDFVINHTSIKKLNI